MRHNQDLPRPELSAVVIFGGMRDRCRRTLELLCRQTALDRIEIIVLDTDPKSSPLDFPSDAPVVYERLEGAAWGELRAHAVGLARAPIVAFLEDHCPPQPAWAEALLEDFKTGPWAAVAYSFRNGGLPTYLGRSAWIASYGFWADPSPAGPIEFMPCNNIAYRKDALLSLGANLAALLSVDFNAVERLTKQGAQFFQSARAVALHADISDVWGLCAASGAHTRLLAARRVQDREWGLFRRIVYAAAAPLWVPPVRLWRLRDAISRRPSLWGAFVKALPLAALLYSAAAASEAVGYLLGAGRAEQRLLDWELEIARAPRDQAGP